MAFRPIPSAMRQLASSATARTARSFQTSSRRLADATPLPVRKPVGAFRGGLFGFFLGSTLTGGIIYYSLLDEYKLSNELLTEDIYALQGTVQRVHAYCQELEEKIDTIEKKR